jgi:hypothetical protein
MSEGYIKVGHTEFSRVALETLKSEADFAAKFPHLPAAVYWKAVKKYAAKKTTSAKEK